MMLRDKLTEIGSTGLKTPDTTDPLVLSAGKLESDNGLVKRTL